MGFYNEINNAIILFMNEFLEYRNKLHQEHLE